MLRMGDTYSLLERLVLRIYLGREIYKASWSGEKFHETALQQRVAAIATFCSSKLPIPSPQRWQLYDNSQAQASVQKRGPVKAIFSTHYI